MNLPIYCYPIPGKDRSRSLCVAFAEGCRGVMVDDNTYRAGGISFFAGVNKLNQWPWKETLKHKDPYLYGDNSYFDKTRHSYYRLTWNAFQHSGLGATDCQRLKKIGVAILPWRPTAGDMIIMCPQSDTFMQFPVEYPGEWIAEARARISAVTKRSVLLRPWSPSKIALQQTLPMALHHAHATVAWSSAALIESVLRGVPIIAEGECAASPMSGSYADIEDLPRLARREWAGILADNQWTLGEIRSGLAWKHLREQSNETRIRMVVSSR